MQGNTLQIIFLVSQLCSPQPKHCISFINFKFIHLGRRLVKEWAGGAVEEICDTESDLLNLEARSCFYNYCFSSMPAIVLSWPWLLDHSHE